MSIAQKKTQDDTLTPHHPAANGNVERFIRYISLLLRNVADRVEFYLMGFGNKNKQKYVGFFILFKRFFRWSLKVKNYFVHIFISIVIFISNPFEVLVKSWSSFSLSVLSFAPWWFNTSEACWTLGRIRKHYSCIGFAYWWCILNASTKINMQSVNLHFG